MLIEEHPGIFVGETPSRIGVGAFGSQESSTSSPVSSRTVCRCIFSTADECFSTEKALDRMSLTFSDSRHISGSRRELWFLTPEANFFPFAHSLSSLEYSEMGWSSLGKK